MADAVQCLAGVQEDKKSLRIQAEKEERVNWIQSLAPWSVMATGTFRWSASVWSARRCFEKFMVRKMPGVSYFYVCERNPCRDGFHVHSLWSDCKGVFRRDVWRDWFDRYGRNLVEPVRKSADVAGYCAKYLVKDVYQGDTWWDVKLQWHHWMRLNSVDFRLCASTVQERAVS